MAEVFYGPWRVVLTHVNSHYSQRFVVARSDSDGAYDVAFGQPLEIVIDGEAWELELQHLQFGEDQDPTWKTSTVRRSTRYDEVSGLIVQLDGATRTAGSAGDAFNNLTLVCTSLDPETHPNPGPSPYDFTIPEHG